jgi:serine/threonine protein kinase
MQKEACLESVGIKWRGKPNEWRAIPRESLAIINAFAQVNDASGTQLFRLLPVRSLGQGTFGTVDEWTRIDAKTGAHRQVAMKRTRHPNLDLFYEALFQHRLHQELKAYKLQACVPEVYDIFKMHSTGDVCFTMHVFTPQLLSDWCQDVLPRQPKEAFALLVLQLALVLEIFEKELHIDHRDLKVNNLLVVNEPLVLDIRLGDKTHTITFPFHIVFVDFGFACIERMLDCKEYQGLPPLDFCPKIGRDIFQVLASIWSLSTVRGVLEAFWGGWVRARLTNAQTGKQKGFVHLAESAPTMDWMYLTTEALDFQAPLCAPSQVIQDLLPMILEKT